jgi:hypothetical protein
MNDTIQIRTKPWPQPTAVDADAMKPRIVAKTLTDGSIVYDVCIRNYGTTYQFDTASLKDAEAIVALFDTGAVVDVSHR